MQRYNIKTSLGPLQYSVAHRPRVRKRIHMELDAHGDLVVIAPRHWSKRQISKILSQNIVRVERFLVNARQRKLEPLQYTQGESHLYLGEHYPLDIHINRGRKAAVEFAGEKITVGLGQNSNTDVYALLHAWYQRQAFEVFTKRLETVSGRALWAKDRAIVLKLRRMKRTWGNCSSAGVIKLNTHLIKAPIWMIDSVVAHELCHLLEMNHGRAFYTLLEGLNPNWKQDRKTLVADGNAYLHQ